MTDRFAPGDADRVLVYGRTTDKTLVGDWNGDGTDTLGVRRDDTPVLSPEGDAEFRVLQWNGEGSERTATLVDTTGAFEGDLNFSAGPSVIRVTATGLWALTPR